LVALGDASRLTATFAEGTIEATPPEISMRATLEQVDNFREFARRQLTSGGADLTIDELFDRWLDEYEQSETIRDVRLGMEQIERGETVTIEQLKDRLAGQTAQGPRQA
jgi:hypothetical protein